jgi:hypothetical protein
VSPQAGKRPQEIKKTSSNPPLPTENRFKIKKSSALASSLQNHAPAQGFPKLIQLHFVKDELIAVEVA